MEETGKFDTWGIVEVMGHNVFAGRVTEQTIAGGAFVRVDVPKLESGPPFTKLIGVGSIYAITPCTEEIARKVAAQQGTRPLVVYDLRQLPAHHGSDDPYEDRD